MSERKEAGILLVEENPDGPGMYWRLRNEPPPKQ